MLAVKQAAEAALYVSKVIWVIPFLAGSIPFHVRLIGHDLHAVNRKITCR